MPNAPTSVRRHSAVICQRSPIGLLPDPLTTQTWLRGSVTPTESDSAWPHVEALAASGITAGCGGGDYCPGATLTRRQMAVFLAKALGLNWPD